MNKRYMRIFLASALGLVAIVGTVAYVRDARRPLSDRSIDLIQAMMHGNAGALMSCATSNELLAEKLTQGKLQNVLDHLLLPYLANTRTSGSPDTEDDTGDVHGFSVARVTRSNGDVIGMSWELFQAEEGLKSPVLKQVLENSWLLRFARKDGKDLPKGEFFRACIAGVKQDKAYLLSLDLPGILPIEPDSQLHTWDEVTDHCQKILDTQAEARHK